MDKQQISYAFVQLMDSNKTKGKELAEYLDVTPATISNYRTGSRSIDIETLDRICDYYGISLDQFFGKEPLDKEEMELLRLWRNADARGKRMAMLALEDAQKSNSVSSQECA